ncbi:MAG: LacI family DNA-binding transcriptional regulator [bacterium]
MNNPASIREVARAAGVSISTVSFVLNGKADRYRIGHNTQARILAVVRQLGYQSTPIVKANASRQIPAASQDGGKPAEKIGLVLSTASPPNSLAMILGLEPVLAVAGYHLIVIVVPADPVATRTRVIQLLHDGAAGIVCCPSVFSAVSATVSSACPVIVLWQGAGQAMVATLRRTPESIAIPVIVDPPATVPEPVPVATPEPEVSASPVPSVLPSPVPEPATTPESVTVEMPAPAPVAEPEETPVQPTSEPDPVAMPEPTPQPTPEPVITPEVAVSPPVIAEPPATVPEPIPVAIPEPVIAPEPIPEAIPVVPVLSPVEPIPSEPTTNPEPVADEPPVMPNGATESQASPMPESQDNER